MERLLSGIARPSGSAYIHGYSGTARAFLEFADRVSDYGKRQNLQFRSNRVCDKLNDFARIFPIAKPDAWLYQGLHEHLFGNRNRALAAWMKSLGYAKGLDLTYQQGLAHCQIGCHLSADQTAGGWGRDEHLQRASEIFTEYEALYDLRLTQAALEDIHEENI